MKNYTWQHFKPDELKEGLPKAVEALCKMVAFEYVEELASDVTRSVLHMISVVNSLSDNSIRKDFIPAAKRHKDDVAKICYKIVEMSKTGHVSNPVESIKRGCITLSDGFEISEEKITPRSFWILYKLFAWVQKTETASQLIMVLQIIMGVFTFYKYLTIQGPLLDEAAEVHISEQLSTEIRESKTTDHINQIVIPFLDHVTKCVEGVERPRSKAEASLVASIRRTKETFTRPVLTPDNLPLGTHSSGMTMPGIEGSIPAILASAFEVLDEDFIRKYDSPEFDTLTGYSPPKCLPSPRGTRIRAQRSVFIPHRSKDDVREIHTASNFIQDRMHYHALVQTSFLRKRPPVAVWDQDKAVSKIVDWFRIDRSKAVYSLDLHAATDTLDRNEQCRVYSYLLRWLGYSDSEVDTLCNHWLHLSSMELTVLYPYSKKVRKYQMSTGQPMGFESSVTSLNLSHDIWTAALIDYVERLYHLEYVGHVILGDDHCSAFKRDPDMVFPHLYQELMTELNTECNLTKGYIYNADIPEYQTPLAEFAKNMICGGENITPLPLGAIRHCCSPIGVVNLVSWYKGKMKLNNIDIKVFADLFDNPALIELISACPATNIFSYIVWGVSKKHGEMPLFREVDDRVLLSVAIPYIRQFFMADVMNELNRDGNYTPKVTDYRSFTKEWRKLARTIILSRDSLDNNKFISLLDRLELIATAQSISILSIQEGINPAGDSELLELIPSLKHLKYEKDLEAFIHLFNLINKVDEMLENHDEIDDSVVLSISQSFRRLVSADFDPTDRRFGSRAEINNLSLDLKALEKEALKYQKLLGVTEEQVNDTLRYLEGCSSSTFKYTWKTERLDSSEEDVIDPWALLDGYEE